MRLYLGMVFGFQTPSQKVFGALGYIYIFVYRSLIIGYLFFFPFIYIAGLQAAYDTEIGFVGHPSRWPQPPSFDGNFFHAAMESSSRTVKNYYRGIPHVLCKWDVWGEIHFIFLQIHMILRTFMFPLYSTVMALYQLQYKYWTNPIYRVYNPIEITSYIWKYLEIWLIDY